MPERSFFVTGTDTGVGKTIVTASLTAALRTSGHDVVPMKPVQTGDDDDLGFSLRASGLHADFAERQRMNPYRFGLGASPHFAAGRAGVVISIDRIVAACQELLSRHKGIIVEGAGGILTPLTESVSMLDVMTALDLPVIVVARPGLGTLNHTLLTVRWLRVVKLDIHAILLNESSPNAWGEIEEDNLRTLRRLAKDATVERFPFVADANPDALARAMPRSVTT